MNLLESFHFTYNNLFFISRLEIHSKFNNLLKRSQILFLLYLYFWFDFDDELKWNDFSWFLTNVRSVHLVSSRSTTAHASRPSPGRTAQNSVLRLPGKVLDKIDLSFRLVLFEFWMSSTRVLDKFHRNA